MLEVMKSNLDHNCGSFGAFINVARIFNSKGERGGGCIGNNPKKPEKQVDNFFQERYLRSRSTIFDPWALWQVWPAEKREGRRLGAGSQVEGGLLYPAGQQSCKVTFGVNNHPVPSQ